MSMLKGFLAAAVAVSAISFVSPQGAQAQSTPGFNCKKARTVVERAICADPDLATKDRRLNDLYRTRMNGARSYGATADVAGLRQAQRDWLAKRDRCQSAKCVHEAYDERLAQLAF